MNITGNVLYARPARHEDIIPVACHLRQSDRDELAAGSGLDPMAALVAGFTAPGRCWTITIRSEPVAMFGVAGVSTDPQFGSAWLLATDRLLAEGRADLRRYSPAYVTEMQKDYAYIGNLVDCRNKASLRWLTRLGFTTVEERPGRCSGLPFVLMVREGKADV